MKFPVRSLSITLGAVATTALGGCYYGDVNSVDYAYADDDCATRYGSNYYDQDIGRYDDGYGYDCYDGADYRGGFAQIGFGGGWYDNYFYPGYGRYLFDNYNNRYPLRGHYLTYWGGRRAWWRHHGHDENGHRGEGRRGEGHREDGNRDGRRGGHRGDPSGATSGSMTTAPITNAVRPGIGRRGDDNSAVRNGGQPDRGFGASQRPPSSRNISSDRAGRRDPGVVRSEAPSTQTAPQPAPRSRPAPVARQAPPVDRPAISETRQAPERSARPSRKQVRPD